MLFHYRFYGLLILGALLLTACRDRDKTTSEPEPQSPVAETQAEEIEADSWKVVKEAVYTDVPAPLEVVSGLEYAAGEIWENGQRNFDLVLRNLSDEPLHVVEVVAACTCTVAESIPNGKTIAPRGEWKTRVSLQAEKLGFGEFKRDIVFNIHQYAPVRLTFTGHVRQAFVLIPGKELTLPVVRDAGEPWELTARISAAAAIPEGLVLENAPEDRYFSLTLTPVAEGAPGYTLRITPKNSLPYGMFKHTLRLPVRGPDYLSHVQFILSGTVATRVQFQPKKVVLTPDSFVGDEPALVTLQCGFDDPAEQAGGQPARGQRRLFSARSATRYVDDIVWPPLFAALQMELPEGVGASKELLRYGIRITLRVERRAFAANPNLEVKLHRDQNYLAPISLVLSDKSLRPAARPAP